MMHRIVVIGAGIAGVPAAYALKRRLGLSDDVTVVSDRDYFHFVPSNPWVAMGWRDYHEVAFPIGPYLKEKGIGFIGSGARRIDPEANRVELENGSVLEYDYLVLATGPEPDVGAVQGAARHAWSVVHIEQAVKAQAAYREFVRRPGPVLVAAAPGAAVLGPAYEFAFLVDEDLRRRGVRNRVPITVLTPEPHAGHLGLGAASEGHELLTAALAERGIEVIVNARTESLSAGELHAVQVDTHRAEAGRHRLPFAFCMFWPAFRGVAALRASAALSDERGLVPVDEYMRHPRWSNVFAAGLCAARAPLEETPVPLGAPASVYSIQNEVETLAHNLAASIEAGPLTSIAPRRAKWLSDMGERGAAFLSEPQIPLRNINWLKQGRWVHEAKVDFENYFINRIKLHGRGGIGNQVATAVVDMQAAHVEGVARLRTRPERPASLEVPLGREQCHALRALGVALGVPPEEVAATLLGAAIRDAHGYLNERLAQEVELARRRILVEELPENQPGVEFEGGAP